MGGCPKPWNTCSSTNSCPVARAPKNMNTPEFLRLAELVNRLSAKLAVVEVAVHSLAVSIPDGTRQVALRDFAQRADSVAKVLAPGQQPIEAETMNIAIGAIQEALGG